jgi:hypothetical protein
MSEKYPIGTRAESERLVREWGFRHIFTWTDGRYVDRSFFPADETSKMGERIASQAANRSHSHLQMHVLVLTSPSATPIIPRTRMAV